MCQTITTDDCKNAKMCIAIFFTSAIVNEVWQSLAVELSKACHLAIDSIHHVQNKNVMSFCLLNLTFAILPVNKSRQINMQSFFRRIFLYQA